MPNRQDFGTWSVELPADWESEADETCVTLSATRRLGALQVSVAFKETGPVNESDLEDFAQEHLSAGASTRDVSFGPFSGFTLALGTEELFQRQWYLASGDQLLFATYTCALADRETERSQVEAILSSLLVP